MSKLENIETLIPWLEEKCTEKNVEEQIIYRGGLKKIKQANEILEGCRRIAIHALGSKYVKENCKAQDLLALCFKYIQVLLHDRRVLAIALVLFLGETDCNFHEPIQGMGGKSAFQIAAATDGQIYRCIVEMAARKKAREELLKNVVSVDWLRQAEQQIQNSQGTYREASEEFCNVLFAYSHVIKSKYYKGPREEAQSNVRINPIVKLSSGGGDNAPQKVATVQQQHPDDSDGDDDDLSWSADDDHVEGLSDWSSSGELPKESQVDPFAAVMGDQALPGDQAMPSDEDDDDDDESHNEEDHVGNIKESTTRSVNRSKTAKNDDDTSSLPSKVPHPDHSSSSSDEDDMSYLTGIDEK